MPIDNQILSDRSEHSLNRVPCKDTECSMSEQSVFQRGLDEFLRVQVMRVVQRLLSYCQFLSVISGHLRTLKRQLMFDHHLAVRVGSSCIGSYHITTRMSVWYLCADTDGVAGVMHQEAGLFF